VEIKRNHIPVKDLDLYRTARDLSDIGWEIYEPMDWQTKKILGDQFISATDSFGANFVEGYSRFHYLDKIKFCYNSRASLSEARDWWLELLLKRKKIDQKIYTRYLTVAQPASLKLQNFINAVYKAKNDDK